MIIPTIIISLLASGCRVRGTSGNGNNSNNTKPSEQSATVTKTEWNNAFKLEEIVLQGNVTVDCESINYSNDFQSESKILSDNGLIKIDTVTKYPSDSGGTATYSQTYYIGMIKCDILNSLYSYDFYYQEQEDDSWTRDTYTDVHYIQGLLNGNSIFGVYNYEDFRYDDTKKQYIFIGEKSPYQLSIEGMGGGGYITFKQASGYVLFNSNKKVSKSDFDFVIEETTGTNYSASITYSFNNYGTTSVTLPNY